MVFLIGAKKYGSSKKFIIYNKVIHFLSLNGTVLKLSSFSFKVESRVE